MPIRKKTKPVVGVRGNVGRRPNRGMRGVVSPKNVRMIENRYQIVRLRRDGFTIQEIAETLDISAVQVHNQLQIALNISISETAETTEESRQLQIERLDLLLKTYTPFATEWHKETRIDMQTKQEIIVECPPDPKYASLILSIEMRRAKLLALDVPETKKLDVTGVREYLGVDLEQV